MNLFKKLFGFRKKQAEMRCSIQPSTVPAPKNISVVVFRYYSPPSDPVAYCKQVLNARFPQSIMVENYVIGTVKRLQEWEASNELLRLIENRAIPNMGGCIDSCEGLDPDEAPIIAFFYTTEGRMVVGECENCHRQLRVKTHGVKKKMHLTCKCGHTNIIYVPIVCLWSR